MEKFFDMPLKGAGAVNDLCKNAQQQDLDKDGRRAGFLMTYGKFKFLDLGDLTWSKEQLACPVNKIGTITVFQASAILRALRLTCWLLTRK
jgi:hypothetical protein